MEQSAPMGDFAGTQRVVVVDGEVVTPGHRPRPDQGQPRIIEGGVESG